MYQSYFGLFLGFCAIMWFDQFNTLSKQNLIAISLLGWAIYVFSIRGGL